MFNQKGNSLIGALVALGCVAVIVAASTNFLTNSKKSTQMMLQVNVRDKIQSTMKTVARLPTSIRVSHDKPGNDLLKFCILKTIVFVPSQGTGDCQNGVEHPITLYGPMVASGGGLISMSGALAGKEDVPVEYNKLGAAIDPASPEPVAMKIRAWFKPQCPPRTYLEPPVDRCDVAETIQIRYEIETVPTDANLPRLRNVEESVVYSVLEISNEPPRIDPEERVPVPLPPPPPPPVVPVVLAGPVGPPPPPPPPPPPLVCIGQTIQIGSACYCPPGQVLVAPRSGRCARVSR